MFVGDREAALAQPGIEAGEDRLSLQVHGHAAHACFEQQLLPFARFPGGERVGEELLCGTVVCHWIAEFWDSKRFRQFAPLPLRRHHKAHPGSVRSGVHAVEGIHAVIFVVTHRDSGFSGEAAEVVAVGPSVPGDHGCHKLLTYTGALLVVDPQRQRRK